MAVPYRPISKRRSSNVSTPGMTPIDNAIDESNEYEPDALTGKLPEQDDGTEKKPKLKKAAGRGRG